MTTMEIIDLVIFTLHWARLLDYATTTTAPGAEGKNRAPTKADAPSAKSLVLVGRALTPAALFDARAARRVP